MNALRHGLPATQFTPLQVPPKMRRTASFHLTSAFRSLADNRCFIVMLNVSFFHASALPMQPD